MANAKRCDICGKYFAIPEPSLARLYNSEAGAVQLFKLNNRLRHTEEREGHHFDACDDCVQEIVDLILTKRATWEPVKEE